MLLKYTFEQYLEKYPPINMPVTLGEDTHHTFGLENMPFAEEMIAQYMQPIEPEDIDEFTEFLPCFRIADIDEFVAVVYWKAALLTYEYVLVTYNLKGEFINRKVIARTHVKGEQIVRSVATIDDEFVIFIGEGITSAIADDFDPTKSKTYNMEILPNGEIIQYNKALN
jgi:hypothetical protein